MTPFPPMVVAIDGPAGAGKSTVARAVAAALDVPYLDTGAMFRSVAWAALDRGISTEDADAIADLAEGLDCRITDETVSVDGVDATEAIRSTPVNDHVSVVAANERVRQILRRQQRSWAIAAGGGVMEGRDIGTVVFPDAALKVWLTASIQERAQRRAAESGEDVEQVAQDLRARDMADSTRQHAPLLRADDAIEVDTTALAPDEVVARIVALANRASLQHAERRPAATPPN